MPVIDVEKLINDRVAALRAMHAMAHTPKAELDLSGGIDSAVMASLLTLAVGRDNLILVHSRFSTDGKQTERAVRLAAALDVPLINQDFGPVFDQLVSKLIEGLVMTAPAGPWWGGPGLKSPSDRLRETIRKRLDEDPTILGSIRSTLRAPIGRAANRLFGGGLRHGTGNECEDRWLRFYQKGGDGEVDSNPIEMLSKTEVYQLAWGLGERFGGAVRDVLRETIQVLPSPDLWGTGDQHNDEDELLRWTGARFTYGRINPETGEIVRYGTIERLSRFLDRRIGLADGTLATGEKLLFDDLDRQDTMQTAVREAQTFHFPEMTQDEVLKLLRAARKVERVTRHKWNPNCPMLGNREDLVADGILSNYLPELKGTRPEPRSEEVTSC